MQIQTILARIDDGFYLNSKVNNLWHGFDAIVLFAPKCAASWMVLYKTVVFK